MDISFIDMDISTMGSTTSSKRVVVNTSSTNSKFDTIRKAQLSNTPSPNATPSKPLQNVAPIEEDERIYATPPRIPTAQKERETAPPVVVQPNRRFTPLTPLMQTGQSKSFSSGSLSNSSSNRANPRVGFVSAIIKTAGKQGIAFKPGWKSDTTPEKLIRLVHTEGVGIENIRQFVGPLESEALKHQINFQALIAKHNPALFQLIKRSHTLEWILMGLTALAWTGALLYRHNPTFAGWIGQARTWWA